MKRIVSYKKKHKKRKTKKINKIKLNDEFLIRKFTKLKQQNIVAYIYRVKVISYKKKHIIKFSIIFESLRIHVRYISEKIVKYSL